MIVTTIKDWKLRINNWSWNMKKPRTYFRLNILDTFLELGSYNLSGRERYSYDIGLEIFGRRFSLSITNHKKAESLGVLGTGKDLP